MQVQGFNWYYFLENGIMVERRKPDAGSGFADHEVRPPASSLGPFFNTIGGGVGPVAPITSFPGLPHRFFFGVFGADIAPSELVFSRIDG